MTILTAVALGLAVTAIITYILLNAGRARPQEAPHDQAPDPRLHSSAAQPDADSSGLLPPENLPVLQKPGKEHLLKNAEFINKNCTRLEDFIINEEINAYDLIRLAHLNGIELQIAEGWYPLTLQLIRELHENGWSKNVSCIKEVIKLEKRLQQSHCRMFPGAGPKPGAKVCFLFFHHLVFRILCIL